MPDAELTADLLLRAYALGVFPMAESRDDPKVFWVDPRRRGILPLDGFHISRSLARRIRRGGYRISVDSDFSAVLDACADRPETWINDRIRSLYSALHQGGAAHSIEVWEDDGRGAPALIGGVYGVTLGAGFFGESMFSRRTDGSKIALAYLVDRLRRGGFTLFDTQFVTPHLRSLGALEIPRRAYHQRLRAALSGIGDFTGPATPTPQALLQVSTQTS
jgi:leucyl/phenylalanyl-tRNA--protein transferase